MVADGGATHSKRDAETVFERKRVAEAQLCFGCRCDWQWSLLCHGQDVYMQRSKRTGYTVSYKRVRAVVVIIPGVVGAVGTFIDRT